MKKFSLICLICIFLGAVSPANAQGVSKCFRADWLQGERAVNLSINGGRVTGTFTVGSGGGAPADATYEFRGTLKGDTLTVAFAGGRLPDVAPSEMKSLVWRLTKAGGREVLRIKFSGKNYETNKYEVGFADFEPCGGGEGYAALARSAKRIRFARGANSASVPASFKTKNDSKAFLLNLKAGQRIEVEAPGCGIAFYYPDKSEYEEGSAIDTWSSDGLKQSGDYLFVIRPAPVRAECLVNFKVMN